MATLNNLKITNFQNIGKPILIASHPRSGTHLTIDLLRKQFAECKTWKKRGEPLDRLYFALESFAPLNNPLSESIALNILSKAKRPIIKTHCDPQFSYLSKQKKSWIDWLQQEADIYYIFRDGRSVLCSLHLFMQSYNPKTRCSLSEFIRQEENGCSRVEIWANHIQAWLNSTNVTVIRFEDLIKNTQLILDLIDRNSNLSPLCQKPLLPKQLNSIWHSRWSRIAKTQSESTAILGYYRNQKVKKWQQAFSKEDREFFAREAGDLLIELGYETSHNWVF